MTTLPELADDTAMADLLIGHLIPAAYATLNHRDAQTLEDARRVLQRLAAKLD